VRSDLTGYNVKCNMGNNASMVVSMNGDDVVCMNADVHANESTRSACGTDKSAECGISFGSSATKSTSNGQRVNTETVNRGRKRIKILKEMPSVRTTGTEFCRRIATANNMLAVSVAGDGSCQYHAVFARISCSESRTITECSAASQNGI
jgi:hypothetical protein